MSVPRVEDLIMRVNSGEGELTIIYGLEKRERITHFLRPGPVYMDLGNAG